MDRPLDPHQVTGRRARRVAGALIAAGLLAGAFASARSIVRPSVARGSLRLAVADVGPVDATVTAVGTVLPEVEEVLSSPVDARVVRILRRPGAALAAGDAILDLDVHEARLALERVRQSLGLKENDEERRRLDLEEKLASLKNQVAIKRLQLETFEASSARNRKLFGEGLVSEETLRQSRLDEGRCRLELEHLAESERLAGRSAEAQRRSLDLETRTLRGEVVESERQLSRATTRTARPGVLTWVVAEEGVAVRKGDALARVADLSAFRVEATVSDVHAARVVPGLPAIVQTGTTNLAGAVSRVLPAIRNGLVTLEVALEDRANASLRSNLRVDVQLVLDRRVAVTRIPKGTLAGTGAAPEIFVVRGDRAIRTPLTLGLSGWDRLEVRAGLTPGDQVVLSDMSSYENVQEVAIR